MQQYVFGHTHVEREAHCARNREFTMKLTINYAYIVLIHLSLKPF